MCSPQIFILRNNYSNMIWNNIFHESYAVWSKWKEVKSYILNRIFILYMWHLYRPNWSRILLSIELCGLCIVMIHTGSWQARSFRLMCLHYLWNKYGTVKCCSYKAEHVKRPNLFFFLTYSKTPKKKKIKQYKLTGACMQSI